MFSDDARTIPQYIDTPAPSHDSHRPCTTFCPRRAGNLVLNGSFSSGDLTNWNITRSYATVNPVQSYNGNNAVRLGQFTPPPFQVSRDNLWQEVCLPANAESITLQYDWLVDGVSAGDLLIVTVEDSYRSVILPFLPRVRGNSTPQREWTTVTSPIPDRYAGQTVIIRFSSGMSSNPPTSFWIDNVRLDVTLNTSP